MSERWYRVAVTDGTTVTLAAAEGAHAGAAITAAVGRIGRRGRVWPVAAAIAPDADIPLGESVGRGVVVLADPPAGLGDFEFPPGVVPTLGGRARAAIAPGLARKLGDDTHMIEAVVAGEEVRDVFLDVLERLPAVDNVEIDVAEHLDPVGAREVWLTPRLRDVRRAVRFLDDFQDDCLTSGHVDVAAYVRSPRSTWRLTQHKSLVWLSDDDALTTSVHGWLTARGLDPIDPVATVAAGPHLHYRGPRSSARSRLLARLKSAGLRRVDAPAR
ncbi:MAG: hypothetical protein IPL61_15675 [Myxococcales bacterium]|nr:hypothetical protein [Myxococcales bacterium]